MQGSILNVNLLLATRALGYSEREKKSITSIFRGAREGSTPYAEWRVEEEMSAHAQLPLPPHCTQSENLNGACFHW